MANVKVLLDQRRAKSDGTFNIIFRITDCKKVCTINSGVSIDEKYWNEKKVLIDKCHPIAHRQKTVSYRLLKNRLNTLIFSLCANQRFLMFYVDNLILFYLKRISFAGNIYLNKNGKKNI
jgi:hypothetical protein